MLFAKQVTKVFKQMREQIFVVIAGKGLVIFHNEFHPVLFKWTFMPFNFNRVILTCWILNNFILYINIIFSRFGSNLFTKISIKGPYWWFFKSV